MLFKIIQLFFILIIFLIILCDNQCEGIYTSTWNATWTDQLKRDLLLKYDKFARPAQHYETTRVYFGMTVYHVSIDEFRSAVNVQAYVRMKWVDEKLKWNPAKYGGLHILQVGNHEVWQPDIVLYNSIAGSAMEHYGDTHCHILEDGTVVWQPPMQFLALCDLDFRFWPFDTQNCELKMSSWMYSGNEIDLRLSNSSELSDVGETRIDQMENTQWRITEITKLRNITFYDCCPEDPYICLIFNLTMRRNSALYNSIFVTPTVFIVFLNFVIFWLPSNSKEKLTLCSLMALIICIFLIYFSQKIPPFSVKSPLIVSFYSGCLYQVTISLVISALVINLSRRPQCQPIPRIVKKILVGSTGRYLGLSDLIQLLQSQRPPGEQELRESHLSDSSFYTSSVLPSNNADTNDRETIITPSSSTAQLEWILAATAIDRISFILFCNIYALMGMTFALRLCRLCEEEENKPTVKITIF